MEIYHNWCGHGKLGFQDGMGKNFQMSKFGNILNR